MQQGDYATEFLLEINASIYQYEQVSYINTGKFEIALELSGNYGDHLFEYCHSLSVPGKTGESTQKHEENIQFRQTVSYIAFV